MGLKFRGSQKGFTLVEILMALVLIATIVGYAIPKLGQSTASQLKTTTRRIIALNKEIRNYARLNRKTYRLVLNLGNDEKKGGISVESAAKTQFIEDKETIRKKKEAAKDGKVESPFSGASEVMKKPISLPFGVKIEKVEYDDPADTVTEGPAYIYFFPDGNAQKAIIHLSNGAKIKWSLIVLPLTGRTILRTEEVSAKDIQ